MRLFDIFAPLRSAWPSVLRTSSRLAVATIAISQLGATDCGNALRDPGFDLWCGDQLCAWKVERGEVERVPTWNEGDPGVALVGDDVAIEQLSPVASTDGACIEFSMIADVDLGTDVYLDIDVFGDGSVERTERIATTHWAPVAFELPISGTYSGVRFELAKTGSGRAVLAQISAKTSATCGGAPIEPAPAPLGARCSENAGCASGLCAVAELGGECVACDDGANACAAGSTCGLGEATSPVLDLPRECVPLASHQLGEPCRADAECATGICTHDPDANPFTPGWSHGTCSTCDLAAHACASGETCGPGWLSIVPENGNTGPWVCSPALHARAHGEPCTTDDDCASSACGGMSRSQCDDGRACATAATCPFGGNDVDSPLQNGPCTIVGIEGGSCQ
jgi:hypothetical protein